MDEMNIDDAAVIVLRLDRERGVLSIQAIEGVDCHEQLGEVADILARQCKYILAKGLNVRTVGVSGDNRQEEKSVEGEDSKGVG